MQETGFPGVQIMAFPVQQHHRHCLSENVGSNSLWFTLSCHWEIGSNMVDTHIGKVKSVSHAVVSHSLRPRHGLQPTKLLCPWDFTGKNTGMGSHSLLQGIFPDQGLNSGVLHCRQILYHLSHQRSHTHIYNSGLYIYSTGIMALRTG